MKPLRPTAPHTERTSSDLESLLLYKNQDVLESFCSSLQIAVREAETIFDDMLRFLWVSERGSSVTRMAIDDPILIIDEMWHIFVLFTKPYGEFCHKYFGRFVHHTPTTETERRERSSIRDMTELARLVEEKRERYGFVYDMLGQDIFIRWYYEYPARYSKEQIAALRLK